MSFADVLGVVGQGLRIGTGLASDIYSMWDSNRRFEQDLAQTQFSNQFAEKQFAETQKYNAYNQYLSENGVQVRANDLAKAGLSKVLASGSVPGYVTGSAGGNVSNHSFGQGLKLNALMNAMQMNKEFQVKDQEIKLLKEQAKSAEIDNQYKEFETGYWKRLGIPSNADMWERRGLGLLDIFKSFVSLMQFGNGPISPEVFNNPDLWKDVNKQSSETTPKKGVKSFLDSIDKSLHENDLDRYRKQEDRIRYTPTNNDYIKNYPKENKKFADQNDTFTYRNKYRYVQKRRGRY